MRRGAVILLMLVWACADNTEEQPKEQLDSGTRDQQSMDVALDSSAVDTLPDGAGVDLSPDLGPPSAWKEIKTTTSTLLGIWGDGPSNIYAVGKGGTIIHYDGNDWLPMTSNVEEDLYAVWGVDNVVFAVGDKVILKYDASPSTSDGGTGGSMTWEEEYTSSYYTYNFRGVWGPTADDIWAVGENSSGEAGVRHSEGSWWEDRDPDSKNMLNDIWGVSATEFYVVGKNGTIFKHDGEDWAPMTSGTTSHLQNIHGVSANQIFATGMDGSVLRFDGSIWSKMNTGSTTLFADIWGSSASDLFAVGKVVFAGDESVMHYNGSAWAPLSAPANFAPEGIWGASSADVYLVGKGKILHYDGI